MFDFVKSLFSRLLPKRDSSVSILPMFCLLSDKDAETEARVRDKLMPSWFTRRLSKGTRRARLSKLTSHELRFARSKGWA